MIGSTRGIAIIVSLVALFITAIITGVISWLFEPKPLQEFVRSILILIAGIPVGLQINRAWQFSQDKNKRIRLLLTIRRVFESNIGYLRQGAKEFNQEVMWSPSFKMDVVSLAGVKHIQYELFIDENLLQLIDRAHFELEHINQRIDLSHKMMLADESDRKATTVAVNRLIQDLGTFNETRGITEKLKSYRNIHLRQLKAIPKNIIMPTPPNTLDPCDTPSDQDFITMHIYNWAYTVKDTLSLMVGLTKRSEVKEIESHSGGAIAHCRNAIGSINSALSKEGYCELFKSSVNTP